MKELEKALKWLLIILLVVLGAVTVRELAPILTEIGQYIMLQFNQASLNPNHYGFGAAMRLILIAVFVGWSINRIQKWNRNKKR